MNGDALKGIAADLVIAVGLAVALLALIDLALSKHQKEWIRGVFETLWIIIADWRIAPLIARMENKRFVYRLCVWFHAGIAMMFLVEFVILVDTMGGIRDFLPILPYFLAMLVAFPIVGFLLRPVWYFLLRRAAGGRNKYLFILWGLVASLLLVLAMWLMFNSLQWLQAQLLPIGLEWLFTGAFFVAFFLIFFAFFFVFFIYGAAILATTAILLLAVARFVVLRLAEYEKGPVLGISATLVALGAVAKAFV